MSHNTGRKIYTQLQEQVIGTGAPTGRIKANTIGDPNYVAPVTDLSMCPLPTVGWRAMLSSAYCLTRPAGWRIKLDSAFCVQRAVGWRGFEADAYCITRPAGWRAQESSASCITRPAGWRGQESSATCITRTLGWRGRESDATCVQTPAPAATLNYSLTQQASPYTDGNLQIKMDGVVQEDLFVDASGTISIVAGRDLSFEAYTVDTSTGVTPLLHMIIQRNGTTIYDNTVPATPGADMLFSEAAVSGATYSCVVTAMSTATVPSEWIADETTSYCETTIEEQDIISDFASPQYPAVSADNNLFYADATLNGVVWFDPTVITDGASATLIPIPATGGGSVSRPTGAYYHAPSNKMYVNSFYGGGLTVIDCGLKAVVNTIAYGTDTAFSRGNVYYLPSLDEIWAIGNSGFLRINATTEAVVTGSISATGAIYIGNVNGKIYILNDFSTNNITVYDATTLTLITTIPNLCVNETGTGAHVSRGYYTDVANNKIYAGENSTTGGVTVIDCVSDTISNRIALDKEGKTYVGPGVIGFHPLRNSVYVGGSIYNDPAVDSISRLWAFDVATETITQTLAPSIPAGGSVSGIVYYPPINSVYISSAGLVPESSPNTGQGTDGVILKYN